MGFFHIKCISRTDELVEVELHSELNIPELNTHILWKKLDELRSMGVFPLSFKILRFDITNSTLYQASMFIASNYEHVRSIYRGIKSRLNEQPIRFVIPEDVDENYIRAFVNQLSALSSVGVVEHVRYIPEERILEVGRVINPNFFTGGWLEIYLTDAIGRLYPFREYLLLKNFKFQLRNAISEADTVLFTERGNFLFEAKTFLRKDGMDMLCYKLKRIANILLIPKNRIFIVVPSEKDIESDELTQTCKGIELLTLNNIEQKLARKFVELTFSN